MDYRQYRQEKGRFILRALLWANLLSALAATGLSYVPINAQSLPWLLLSLLPWAVILWAVFRGSFPALVLMMISLFNDLNSVVSTLQFGGADTIAQPIVLLSVASLLIKLFTMGAIRSSTEVSAYFNERKWGRTRKDLILEVILFVVSLLLSYAPSLYSFYFLFSAA